MIKKIIFCLSIFLILTNDTYATTLEEAKKECLNSILEPSVNFKEVRGNTYYNNKESSDKLTQMATDILSANHKARGLTTSKIGYKTQVNVNIVKYNHLKYTCVLLKNVDYTIGYNNIIVYIANKYRPKSCEYKAVLDHENKHVEITKNSFEYYLPFIKKKAEEAAKTIKPYFVNSDKAKETLNEINDKITSYIRPTWEFGIKERDKKNAELDSSESYAYTEKLCPNW